MRSSDLTPDQAHAIDKRLGSMSRTCSSSKSAWSSGDFPRDDKLYRMVKRAHNAMHDLFLDLHEIGCKGVGRRQE